MIAPVVICVTFTVMILGIVMSWSFLQYCYLYIILTCSCLLVGPSIMILINIALSPKHQTGSGAVKIIAEMDAFHNMLMVCLFSRESNKTIEQFFSFIIINLLERIRAQIGNQQETHTLSYGFHSFGGRCTAESVRFSISGFCWLLAT